MKESTKTVIKYLQSIGNEDVTAADVAERLGIEKKRVDGIFTAALQRKEYGYRQEAEVEVEVDGKITHKTVKFLKLTDAGLALDVDAEPEKADN